MRLHIFGLLIAVNLATGCVTTHSEGFVNYKEVGDVFGSEPQTVDYEEVGPMTGHGRGFLWTNCSDVCKDAVVGLKEMGKMNGGDTLFKITYQRESLQTKTPTCATHWSWAWLVAAPLFGPWVKTCDVEGLVVARAGRKSLENQALKKQAEPIKPTKLNSKNTQNGDTTDAEIRPGS